MTLTHAEADARISLAALSLSSRLPATHPLGVGTAHNLIWAMAFGRDAASVKNAATILARHWPEASGDIDALLALRVDAA